MSALAAIYSNEATTTINSKLVARSSFLPIVNNSKVTHLLLECSNASRFIRKNAKTEGKTPKTLRKNTQNSRKTPQNSIFWHF